MSQKAILKKYAQEQGFRNIQFFVDDGYSGANFNRPDWKRMIELVENDKVGVIIAKDMIAANPADKVTLPRKKKFYGQSYSVEEVQQLLSVLNDDPIRPAVILAVMYGLRRSEAVGLRWKDIDFKNKTMTICNTVTRMATVHELEDTKNESSHRTLPLIPGTEEYLQSLRREQKETMLLCGNRFDDSCHVCTWPDGRSLQPDYVSQHFNQVLKKNNFRVIRYHDLRHTAGSMLLQKGIDIKTIQHFLGHSQASTTVNIYLHSISNGTVDAANAIGSMVNVGTVCQTPGSC